MNNGGGVSTFIPNLNRKVERAVQRVADKAAKVARDLCPVDSGDLRSTIRTEVEHAAGVNQVSVSVKVGGEAGKATGEYVDYAHYVLRGTERMPPNPFMQRAAAWLRQNFHRQLKEQLRS